MTTKEALEVFREEDHSIRILRDPETGDIFITKPTGFGMTPPTILAWVCGQEADRFISYEGLNSLMKATERLALWRRLCQKRERENDDNMGE